LFDTKILIIDKDLTVCSSIKLLLKRQDYEVDSISFPKIALKNIERFDPDLVLLNVEFEISISKVLSVLEKGSLILMTDLENLPKAVEGMKLGAAAFISNTFTEAKLVTIIQSQLTLKLPYPEKLTRMRRMSFGHIIGDAPVLLDILNRLDKIATSGANVLIEGESGTGKTLIAETILNEKKKTESKFVKHIDGMSIAQQAQFSQQLFNSKNSLRILSSTNKNLNELLTKGDFREDLFYQLNSIRISIPSLNERIEDLPLLANNFLGNLKKLFKRPELRIDGFAAHWLQQQTFKGNVRQLKILVERTALASIKGRITADDFKAEFQNAINGTPVYLYEIGELTQEQLEILMLKQALTIHENNKVAAARLLGWTKNSFYQKMKKYGIDNNK